MDYPGKKLKVEPATMTEPMIAAIVQPNTMRLFCIT